MPKINYIVSFLACLILLQVPLHTSARSNNLDRALNELSKCGAISVISANVFVPKDARERIAVFDDALRKYLSENELILRRASRTYSHRAAMFMDIYRTLHPNGDRLKKSEIRAEVVRQQRIYIDLIPKKKNGDWGDEMALDSARCQLMVVSLPEYIGSNGIDRSKQDYLVNAILVASAKSPSVSEDQLAVIFVAVAHWKHHNFITQAEVDAESEKILKRKN